jgi:hypothetical protein
MKDQLHEPKRKLNPIDDWSLSIAAEDRYVLIDMNKPEGLLPTGSDAEELLVGCFKEICDRYQPILDLGNLNDQQIEANPLTDDILDFVKFWAEQLNVTIISDPSQDELLEKWPRHLPKPIRVHRRDWKYTKYESDVLRAVGLGQDYLDREYQPLSFDELISTEAKELQKALNWIGTNSLMTQIAFIGAGRKRELTVVPYHAHAVYESIPDEHIDELVFARPAVLARRTSSILSNELNEFNRLIGSPSVTEHEIQTFFERNTAFIEMLGYKAVYPKVVLERDDGTSLIPDFMLEPIGNEWWDILDIKLPHHNLIVGGRDRIDFSHAVNQLRAQLREYGAYFDEEKHRRRIEQRYGIKSYKPRLIGLIGDMIDGLQGDQLRRVMTQYADFEVITFDKLRQLARHHLLI